MRNHKLAILAVVEVIAVVCEAKLFCARAKRVLRLASARSKTSVEREALDGRTGPKLHGCITTQYLLGSETKFRSARR